VLGADQPGLVERLSQVALAHGANWEQSKMARLAGHFAGILLVTVDAEAADALERELRGLEATGLRIAVDRSGDEAREQLRALRLELGGHDRPGIIREISRALAARDVNLDELATETRSAPMTGDNLFHMTAALRTSPQLSIEELRRLLEGLGNDLMVDIELMELSDPPKASDR